MAYVVDHSVVLLKIYRLSTLFLASKELRRKSAPDEYPDNEALRDLEAKFFMTEASSLLLEIAIAIRVVDDQMMGLGQDEARRIEYERRIKDACKWGPLTTLVMPDMELRRLWDRPLRFICNKIIHASGLQPLVRNADGLHDWDTGIRAALETRVAWKYLNGEVVIHGNEPGGRKGGKGSWTYILDIVQFTRAAWSVLAEPLP